MNSFMDRIVRAVKLDCNLYKEVEKDHRALKQAMGVVVLSSIAAGIGTLQGVSGLIGVTLTALFGWYIWAFTVYYIGTKLIPEPQTKATFVHMLATIGFASSPGLIRILGVISPLRKVIFFVAAIWMLVAMVIAVRQVLDYKGTGRAIAVCVIGWLVHWVIAVLVLAVSQTIIKGSQVMGYMRP